MQATTCFTIILSKARHFDEKPNNLQYYITFIQYYNTVFQYSRVLLHNDLFTIEAMWTWTRMDGKKEMDGHTILELLSD